MITSKEIDKKALTELGEIISHMEESLREKIPEEVYDVIKENKDKDYEFKYYKGVTLMPETKALLSVILSEYICSENNKAKWKEYDRNAKLAIEANKTKYNSEEMFGKNRARSEVTELEENQSLMIHKENMLTRIVNKIKNIFKKNTNE